MTVDPSRLARSFARQSAGAILNASVSFQVAEDEADAQIAELDPALPEPEIPTLRNDSWGALLDRRAVNLPDGRVGYWIRLTAELGRRPGQPRLRAHVHVRRSTIPQRADPPTPTFANDESDRTRFVGASLDHSVWFHRPSRADEWHWFDTRSHGLAGGRGFATGDVLRADGTHVATIAQQILLRRNRNT